MTNKVRRKNKTMVYSESHLIREELNSYLDTILVTRGGRIHWKPNSTVVAGLLGPVW